MAKLIFAMAQSLDGYVAAVDGSLEPPLHGPGEELFRYFVELERSLAGTLYGRRIYEIMRYWEDDRAEWTPLEHEYAEAWRRHPKWVVSRTLKETGPNATLVSGELETFVRRLKSEHERPIGVAGPELASSLTKLGLIDEYHLILRPFVLGTGKPYFAGGHPTLRLVGNERVGEDAVRLVYETM